MTGDWKFVSEDAGSISLHDCRISSMEESGADLFLYFEDGFDVTRDNPLNPTGRHRNTGPSAIVLKSWHYQNGVFGRGCERVLSDGTRVPLPEVSIPQESFLSGLEPEILDFDWNREAGRLELSCDCWSKAVPPETGGFAELILGCDRLLFCWNELPRDAWFQDWPK